MKLTKQHYLKIIASFKRNKSTIVNNLIETKGLIRDLNNILPNKEYIAITDLFNIYATSLNEVSYIELSLNAINDLMDYLKKNNEAFNRALFFNKFSEDVMSL